MTTTPRHRRPARQAQCGIRARPTPGMFVFFGTGSGAADGAPEPGAGVRPEAVRRPRGDVQGPGRLVDRQAGEVAELDQLSRLGVGDGQPGERLVHREDLVGPLGGGRRVLAEFDPGPAPAALETLLVADVIDEDAA